MPPCAPSALLPKASKQPKTPVRMHRSLKPLASPPKAETTLTIRNKLGLHARPAASFVKAAMCFRCDIFVSHKQNTVSAKSILGVLTLAAHQGSRIRILAEGEDATLAIAYLTALVESGLGET